MVTWAGVSVRSAVSALRGGVGGSIELVARRSIASAVTVTWIGHPQCAECDGSTEGSIEVTTFAAAGASALDVFAGEAS